MYLIQDSVTVNRGPVFPDFSVCQRLHLPPYHMSNVDQGALFGNKSADI